MEYLFECDECGYSWINNYLEPFCPRCGSCDISAEEEDHDIEED